MTEPDFFQPGFRTELGSHVFTAGEIIRFARRYDPQPFHLDEALARQSVLGGLCASGWHTVSMWMRKHRDAAAQMAYARAQRGEPRVEFGPSPGFEDLHWRRPVFAGATIAYSSTTSLCRPSASRPGWYVLSARNEAENANGDPVLTFASTALVRYPAD